MERNTVTLAEIAQVLDHSLLRPELTLDGLREGCALAREYAVVSVCVRPSDLPVAGAALAGSQVRLTTTVGFPHGVTTTAAKVAEARDALDQGAVELDMVMNVGRLRSGELRYVEDEIRALAEAAHARGALLKVIFENHYLDDEQKVAACRLSEAAGPTSSRPPPATPREAPPSPTSSSCAGPAAPRSGSRRPAGCRRSTPCWR